MLSQETSRAFLAPVPLANACAFLGASPFAEGWHRPVYHLILEMQGPGTNTSLGELHFTLHETFAGLLIPPLLCLC